MDVSVAGYNIKGIAKKVAHWGKLKSNHKNKFSRGSYIQEIKGPNKPYRKNVGFLPWEIIKKHGIF
jgi:hypothetical protein